MPEAKEVRCSPLNAIPKNPQSRKAWCLDGLHEDLSGVAATTSSKGKRFPVIPALSKSSESEPPNPPRSTRLGASESPRWNKEYRQTTHFVALRA
ncbi:hypothetical protein E4U22_006679 [Claviceps purpurea]|nr:hypothetical protein E4U22_006679 [Claviceps purpurea]